MSGTATQQTTTTVAGNKRRSLPGPGGSLLNRMFGSSNGSSASKDPASAPPNGSAHPPGGDGTADSGGPVDTIQESTDEAGALRSPTRKADDQTDKKRRSSGVGRARELFSSARQSLSNLGSSAEPKQHLTAMQKLGRQDPALSVPAGSLNNSAGESAPGPRSTFRVGVTEDRNKKCRRTMEDTHAYLYNFLSTPAPVLAPESSAQKNSSLAPLPSRDSTVSCNSVPSVVETDNGYFAIFDGHAGAFAAEWCGKKVHILLEDMIRKNPNTPIPELLDMTFTTVDQQLEKLPLKNSGCTAVIAVLRWEDRVPNPYSPTGSVALAPAAAQIVNAEHAIQQAIRQRVLYTANVGDARIILCRNGKALRLSYDHKGSDENEGKRIAGAGGLILNNRVNGVLAVTRALGDAYMKDLVTGHPYTTETVIRPEIDEFLILACDGLWDVCSDQEAVDLVRSTHDPQVAAKQLVEHALARFSTDNLSCMVVRFDNDKLRAAREDKDNRIGVDGDPTTKPGGISEADAIVRGAKRHVGGGSEPSAGLSGATANDLMDDVPQHQETGPELNPEALEAARKDTRPKQHPGRPHPPDAPNAQDTRAHTDGGNDGPGPDPGHISFGNGDHQNQGGSDDGSRDELGPGSRAGMPGMPGGSPHANDGNDGPSDANNGSVQAFHNTPDDGGGDEGR